MNPRTMLFCVAAVVGLLAIAATTRAQLSPEEAQHRLEEMNQRAATRPATPATVPIPTSQPARAMRVVFLIETRGNTLTKAPSIKNEVYAAITELPKNAQFNIVLCGEGSATPVFQGAGAAHRREQEGRAKFFGSIRGERDGSADHGISPRNSDEA